MRMPRKFICKNHCDGCEYESPDIQSEVCMCGIYPYNDDNDELGCNYKASTLRKLYRYTELELDEYYTCRHDIFTDSWIQEKKDIEEKEERGEQLSAQEEVRLRSLSKDIWIARMMDFDHRRCNYIRLINELDDKGEFKRLLRKLGRYPKWVDDFTIGIEWEER